LVYVCSLNLDTSIEGAIYNLAGKNVLELGSHESGTLAWLDVLELDYGPKLTVDVQYDSVF
ncbi:MAG: hypothetical protein RLZZ514_1084, partial [Actinomycetota bacterium]